MPLFAELDAVDWKAVTHAYGPAIDVPDLLRALADPERASATTLSRANAQGRSIRKQVIWELWGNVFHQGTVWQASSKVIPFLVELLRDGPADTELQTFLVSYLHHLAYGYPLELFPTLIDPEVTFAGAREPRPDDDDPYNSQVMSGYARDCYRGVEAALPAIAPFAHAEHDAVALPMLALLGGFRTQTSRDTLLEVIERNHSGPRFAVALVALAQLDPASTLQHAAPRIDDPDRHVGIHAAVACVLADPQNALTDAIAVLTAPIPDDIDNESPLSEELSSLVGCTLALLPAEYVPRTVYALASRLPSLAPMARFDASATLLRLVFKNVRATTEAQLTELQRHVVTALAEHGAWRLDANHSLGNFSLMLTNYGLPATADELRRWLTPN